MFTICSTCRPFDHYNFGLIQRNALVSWSLLRPKPQILILGSDRGSAEVCRKLNFTHIPNIPCSKYGTPRFDRLLKIAEDRSIYNHMCWVSSDIILVSNIIKAYRKLCEKFGPDEFCAVSRKLSKKIDYEIDFKDNRWREKTIAGGKWSLKTSGDFFIWTKGYMNGMPPLMTGRCVCDGWMFKRGYEKGSMVDLTKSVWIVDQLHNRTNHKIYREELEWNMKNYTLERDYTHEDSYWIMNKNLEILSRNSPIP